MISLTLIRYALAGYLLRTSVVLLTLVAVSLAIDLAEYRHQVLSGVDLHGPVDQAARLLWYCTLRSVDVVTRFLGVAVFLGIFWWEFGQNRSGERVAVWNAGITPLGAMTPPVLFAVLLIGVQSALEFWLRPAAVLSQIDSGLGAYGEDYGRTAPGSSVWFVAGDDLVATRIDYGPPVTLRNPIVYRLSDSNRLLGVIAADSASPGREAGMWTLGSARQWQVDAAGDTLTGGHRTGRLEVPLSIDPQWLRYRRIPAKYLPHDAIVSFARQDLVGTPSDDYKAWRYVRYSSSLLPALLSIVAFSVGVASFGRPLGIPLLLLCIAPGYLLHVLSKTTILLAEFGEIAPLTAALAPTAVTLPVVAALHLGRGRIIGPFLALMGRHQVPRAQT